MAEIAVIVSETKGGLIAVAEDCGFAIIDDSVREFDSLTTCSTPGLSTIGYIDTGKEGWIALAELADKD